MVYDIDARRVSAAVPVGGFMLPVSELSIDPDDEVVAAVLPNSIDIRRIESTDNTLGRWDLRTGQQHDVVGAVECAVLRDPLTGQQPTRDGQEQS